MCGCRYVPEYYLWMDKFLKEGAFVGKSQTLMSMLAMRHADRVAILPGHLCRMCANHY